MGNTHTEKIKEALHIAEENGPVFIFTVGTDGRPHVAAARGIETESEGKLAITEWFCPNTLENLTGNPCLSVVVWDTTVDVGYQFLGRLDRIQDMGVLDGFAPAEESEPPLPQVLRKLVMDVEEVLTFKRRPHSDRPLKAERR